jgi:2-dehydro-3-deoxy-L-rhamnonate dehydrogenase (NAD+)
MAAMRWLLEAQGFGFAIAERLMASGASVSLWDRDGGHLQDAADKLQGLGVVTTEVMDVSDAASVKSASDNTFARHAAVDILVASAGVGARTLRRGNIPLMVGGK